MKTILRNLFYTLKRFRSASVLNLLGLSTAFAAFMLIMMKASYEYNFDTCYPDSDRLVMLNFGEEKDSLLIQAKRTRFHMMQKMECCDPVWSTADGRTTPPRVGCVLHGEAFCSL